MVKDRSFYLFVCWNRFWLFKKHEKAIEVVDSLVLEVVEPMGLLVMVLWNMNFSDV